MAVAPDPEGSGLDLQRLRGSRDLHPSWVKRLAALQRPSARALVPQLVPDNALGYDAGPTLAGRRGTLFDFVVSQKRAHPDKVRKGLKYRIK